MKLLCYRLNVRSFNRYSGVTELEEWIWPTLQWARASAHRTEKRSKITYPKQAEMGQGEDGRSSTHVL